ncbi:MAG: hypothetical protein KCHDKBKB_02035 [Elusimicrobia bacterium]|nr:hypothetical protein [Elusimicrobiota bacterium]
MKIIIISVLFGLTGCISIGTHERLMKKMRDTSAELEQTQAKLIEVENKNSELRRTLEEESEEHAILQSELSNVRNTYDELIEELKDDIAKGSVGVKETEKGLTITMGNQILFSSGKATLQPHGKKVLTQISNIIKKAEERMIQVEGHTDNQRIVGSLKNQFPSNWELSSARAASVIRFLQLEGGIDPDRLILTAFSEYRPLADNSTAQGRQQNRRVEITLLTK